MYERDELLQSSHAVNNNNNKSNNKKNQQLLCLVVASRLATPGVLCLVNRTPFSGASDVSISLHKTYGQGIPAQVERLLGLGHPVKD